MNKKNVFAIYEKSLLFNNQGILSCMSGDVLDSRVVFGNFPLDSSQKKLWSAVDERKTSRLRGKHIIGAF
jgi:hypothetical protein